MKKFNKLKILFALSLTLIIFACAKQVAITGGPKDTTPPVMVESVPVNGSVNFNENAIYIKFDEYIKLNNLNQKLVISPPIEDEPDVTIKGKGIKISLNPDILEPNTTYSLNFNDAIADNNENNALNSFVYAFSTGETIDSLSFSGHVLDAFTREPITDAWVILHDVFIDSVIKTYNPGYLTKVDEEGKFFIPFVKENDYKIFGLVDNNYNYMFDIPEEGIAFMDTVFRPGVESVELIDTAGNTNLSFNNYPNDIELLIFNENKQAQFIIESKRFKPDYFEFVFNSTQYEEYSVSIPQDNEAIIYAKHNPDTVKIWLQNKDAIIADSIAIFVYFTDPVYTDTLRTDTLVFRKPETELKDSLIQISVNKIKEPHKPLLLHLNVPVDAINSDLISLELKSDSTFINTDFTIKKDSLNPLLLNIEAKILEKSDYRIIISDAFLETNYGLSNLIDTLNFSSSSTLEYGNLKLSFENESANFIVQILSGDKVTSEVTTMNGIADFHFLKPAKYHIRAILDVNNNGRWDTGDYDIHLQPEQVFYYPQEYEIRSNWNHEIDWNPTIRK